MLFDEGSMTNHALHRTIHLCWPCMYKRQGLKPFDCIKRSRNEHPFGELLPLLWIASEISSEKKLGQRNVLLKLDHHLFKIILTSSFTPTNYTAVGW